MQLANFVILIFTNLLVVSGQMLMKQGMTKIGSFSSMPFSSFLVKTFLSPLIVAGISFYVVSTVLWLMLLSRVNLSIAYPGVSLGYILILFVSWFFLKETISVYQIVGIFLIIAGIYLIYVINPATNI